MGDGNSKKAVPRKKEKFFQESEDLFCQELGELLGNFPKNTK